MKYPLNKKNQCETNIISKFLPFIIRRRFNGQGKNLAILQSREGQEKIKQKSQSSKAFKRANITET